MFFTCKCEINIRNNGNISIRNELTIPSAYWVESPEALGFTPLTAVMAAGRNYSCVNSVQH
jgi:hypothetical protein